ncbi:MAG TPA: hypothetical protein VMM84_16735 [Pyrinomonadaceae bacterium]|nr:hypothetical protein [Pyrinomonadaceae bacterium]
MVSKASSIAALLVSVCSVLIPTALGQSLYEMPEGVETGGPVARTRRANKDQIQVALNE